MIILWLDKNCSVFFFAGTVFAYGVTSSGKTHTMHVSDEDRLFL